MGELGVVSETMGMNAGIRKALVALPTRRLFEPRFVIVGTGRSGTRYISEVLTASGIRCGHEQWWGLGGRSMRLDGDASWLATFQLDGYRGRVFHQVRDPIKVIRSLVGLDLSSRQRNRRWTQYRALVMGGLSNDPVFDAMRIVDMWVTESEGVAERTWRVEDVDAELISEIAEAIGKQATPELDIPRDLNTRTDIKQVVDLDWGNLPNSTMKDRLMNLAARYGYL